MKTKLDLMKTVEVIGWAFLSIYFLSMVVFPSIHYCLNWKNIHAVWHDWQTFNAAMIAFASSLIAFKITTYKEEKQRQRNFIAARAALPNTLRLLTKYCKNSLPLITEINNNINNNASCVRTPLKNNLPNFPKNTHTVFQECIRYADDAFGNHLSTILSLLQIYKSRLAHLYNSCGPNSYEVHKKDDMYEHIYLLIEIQTYIDKTYDYARGKLKFINKSLTWTDFDNTLSSMNIDLRHFSGIGSFIKEMLEHDLSNTSYLLEK